MEKEHDDPKWRREKRRQKELIEREKMEWVDEDDEERLARKNHRRKKKDWVE